MASAVRAASSASIWALALSVQLAVPLHVHAVELRAPEHEKEIRDLYDKGNAAYSASDYETAARHFTRILELLPGASSSQAIRGGTLYNLGQTYQKSFEVTHDVADLRRARATFRRYLDEAEEGFDYPDVDQVKVKLAALEEQLAELEADGQGAGAPDDEGSEAARPDEAASDRASIGDRRGGRNRKPMVLTIAGASLSAAGAAFVGVMGAGLAMGKAADDEGYERLEDENMTLASDYDDIVADGVRANRLAWSMGIVGGALLTTGITLVIVGQVSKRRQGGRMAFMPSVGRQHAGAHVSFSF